MTPWTAAKQTSLSSLSHCIAQSHVHWLSEAIQSSHSLLLPSAFTLSFSQHQNLFQWVGFSHQVTKVLELQLQHQYSNEYSGLILFRNDWFDLAVQGTLKSLLQYHSLKASIKLFFFNFRDLIYSLVYLFPINPCWAMLMVVVVWLLGYVQLSCGPMDCTALQALLSMGFPRYEYWNGLPFPSLEDFPNPGIELGSSALAGRFFTTELPGKPHVTGHVLNF